MKNLKLWKFIYERIIREGAIALCIVAETSESSPGKQGFKMAVSKSGEQFGTIGGGIMEANIVKDAAKLINSGKKSTIHFLHHNPNSNLEKSGLICGGTQTVIIKILAEPDLDLIEKIVENYKHRIKCSLKINSKTINLEKNNGNENRFKFKYTDEAEYLYAEICGTSETAYIIGGGHVGLATSRIMSYLDFYVINFDHRRDVFTLQENEYADQKIICEYTEISQYIDEGEMSYVIIVTPQHTGDKAALKSVINKRVKYIGMMGGEKKIETVFRNLEKDGIDRKLFKKVHTPIGLEIEAETPEEIAVSIAAQIIQIKNL